MSKRAVVTVVTRNYLAYARALMAACRRHEPDASRYVVIADRLPAGVDPGIDDATIIHGDQLGVADWDRFSFQYTPFELACALKPHALAHLTRHEGCDRVVYLDGDMGLYGPLEPVWEALEEDAIVLTPHLLRPLPDDGLRPHESAFQHAGPFNAGFLAIRQAATSDAFVAWWRSMCDKHCFVDLAGGQFVDQRWLGMVPGMFADVRILRHFGINAGHWSLSQARFESRPTTGVSESGLFVDADPLILFHFSGMTPHRPTEYLQSQNRASLQGIPRLKALCDDFHREVHAGGLSACSQWGSAFDVLSDGTPIHPGWREAIRRDEAMFAAIADPFDVDAHPRLKAMYRNVEGTSHMWRRDWRLQWEKSRGVRGAVRAGSHRLRDSLRVVRGFFKAS